VDPNGLFDFRLNLGDMLDANMKDFGLNDSVQLVGCFRRKTSKIMRIVVVQKQTNFLAQFPAQRTQGRFIVLDFATCLHKPVRSGFPHKQQATRSVIDERR